MTNRNKINLKYLFCFFVLSTKLTNSSSKFVLMFIYMYITSLKTWTVSFFYMRQCLNCNRDYSDKFFRKHCRSNKHMKKAFEVKYIYKKENILVNEVDNTLSNIINKHKRKFYSFLIVCKINNNKNHGISQTRFINILR